MRLYVGKRVSFKSLWPESKHVFTGTVCGWSIEEQGKRNYAFVTEDGFEDPRPVRFTRLSEDARDICGRAA